MTAGSEIQPLPAQSWATRQLQGLLFGSVWCLAHKLCCATAAGVGGTSATMETEHDGEGDRERARTKRLVDAIVSKLEGLLEQGM